MSNEANLKLSRLERLLYAKVSSSCNSDVTIDELYSELHDDGDAFTPRERQQRLGSVIARINRKLADVSDDPSRIVPGEMKRTYRLQVKAR